MIDTPEELLKKRKRKRKEEHCKHGSFGRLLFCFTILVKKGRYFFKGRCVCLIVVLAYNVVFLKKKKYWVSSKGQGHIVDCKKTMDTLHSVIRSRTCVVKRQIHPADKQKTEDALQIIRGPRTYCQASKDLEHLLQKTMDILLPIWRLAWHCMLVLCAWCQVLDQLSNNTGDIHYKHIIIYCALYHLHTRACYPEWVSYSEWR